MKSPSCVYDNYDVIENKLLPALYTITFIIGFVGNAWGLKLLLQKWQKLGNINIFVLNLGLSNVLYLFTLPFLMVYYFTGRKWIFGGVFCKMTRFCFNLNLYCSIGFLTCISVYRYLAIVHPLRMMGRLTVTRSVAISVLVWVLVSVQSIPDIFFPKTMNGTDKCFHSTSFEKADYYLKYSLVWTTTGFCIPLLIILGCYGHVAVVLCRRNTIEKTLKQKSVKFLFILILLFSVCYIPYHIFWNLSLYSRALSKQEICVWWDKRVFTGHQISRGLVCLNSALNPLVYLQMTEHIVSHIRQLPQQVRKLFRRVNVCSSNTLAVSKTEEEALEQSTIPTSGSA
ncbi:P2Y purinoceptor 1 [Oryzias melastigma]|uniref:P2Y purinoceptor 1-like n=1 Tax=Oryzias melastigma TaxID=30732 RepID=A0A3B3C782_ORYME|nr:P2Y purinoceptor 1 [Oryzias melastigma]